jgi:predicted glycoside hydrolase/deacetylase ChbG (UPF0249 family)
MTSKTPTKLTCLFLASCMVSVVGRADEATYAERLGWPAGTRALLLHVDDAGMCHDANVGTIEALEKGVANSVSVMMPCAWVPEVVNYLKTHPDVDAGLHLTMTSEWDVYGWGPLAGKPTVPGLVDEEGCMWDKVRQVVEHASPDEVEKEIRAQLDRARTMGFEPTHMDSHMGTMFASREFLERYVKVAIDTQIPVLFIDRVPGAKDLAKKLWDAKLPLLDHVHTDTYDWKTTDKADLYVQAIRQLKPGITYFIMHCTRTSESFPSISGSGPERLGDLNAMLDPRVRQVLKEEKIVMTTMRELKQRRQKVAD